MGHTVVFDRLVCGNGNHLPQFIVLKLVPCGTDGRILLSGDFRNFRGPITLTLDWVTRHTVVHQSSTSMYIPSFIEIGKTFLSKD